MNRRYRVINFLLGGSSIEQEYMLIPVLFILASVVITGVMTNSWSLVLLVGIGSTLVVGIYATLLLTLGKRYVANQRAYQRGDDKSPEIARVVNILREHGQLPYNGIKYFYKKLHGKNISQDAIMNAVRYGKELEEVVHDGTFAVALKHGLSDIRIPMPAQGDYVSGYYQMYHRLELVKAHPELLDVPLDMVDTLYGVKA
jgi:hypothetical protein